MRLVDDLENEGVLVAGTVRRNKLHATPELVDKATLQTMDGGDYIFQTKGNVPVTVWKDNKEIHLISDAYLTHGGSGPKRPEVILCHKQAISPLVALPLLAFSGRGCCQCPLPLP